MPADPAGHERQVGFREIALHETDPAAGPFDVVGRTDDVKEVTALEDGPRLARHQLRAALHRLEIDASREGVLRQLAKCLSADLRVRHDD
jgi:hypothetical protein